jgi:hypothetical protein
MDDTILTLRFTDVGRARAALDQLERRDRDGQLRVRAAALVERSREGGIGVPHGAGDVAFLPHDGVGGMLLSALGGPLGSILAPPADGFEPNGKPSAAHSVREEAPEELRRDHEPRITFVIAEIEDPDPDVLDATLDRLGGTTTRRSAAAVYAELRAAGPLTASRR